MAQLRWMASLVLVCLLLLTARGTQAQSAKAFTLQPKGKATITFEAFCSEFGDTFPAQIQLPTTKVTNDKTRAALAYIQQQGLNADPAKALQAQFAIWQSLGQNGPKGDATTQDVLTNGTAAPAAPQGTSLLDAAAANEVKLTLDSWAPIGDKVQITPTASDHFYGKGVLTVENVSDKELTLYMPVGTVFGAPNASEQDMIGYATDVQVNNPQQTLPTTGATEDVATLVLVMSGLLILGGFGVRRMSRTR